MPESVLGEAEVIVWSVVNGEEEAGGEQQSAAGREHAKDFVDGALRLRQVLQHLSAQDDVKTGIADAQQLRVADDLNGGSPLHVQRDTARKECRVGPILRTDIECAL